LDTSTVPRGQAVHPSQDGFHFLKREWAIIPFIFGKKKTRNAFGASHRAMIAYLGR
jgi:hypothetical protein